MINIENLINELEIENLHESDLSITDSQGNSQANLYAITEDENGCMLEVYFLAMANHSDYGRIEVNQIIITDVNCWENDTDEYRLNELEYAILEDVLREKIEDYY